MTRTGIYARVSTTDQTCEQQLTALREFCHARQWPIAHEYVDHGFSGGAKTARPAFNRIIADARARRLDAVVVWKLDRFGRSLQHLVQVTQELTSLGVRFVAVTQGIDTDKSNPTAQLVLHILACFAEFERAIISERTVAGLRQARARGSVLGRKARRYDAGKLIRMHAAGCSLSVIAKDTGLSRSTISRILLRERNK
jgi:putative DNA-invertase from lambdoid prophage Rac